VIVGFVPRLRHLVAGVIVVGLCGAVIRIVGLVLLRDIQSLADPVSWLLLAASVATALASLAASAIGVQIFAVWAVAWEMARVAMTI
jgi:hypothetical protein